MTSAFRYYLASTCAFLLPGGMQMVLFPWLVAVQLQAEAFWVGVALMANQLPAVLLVLIGGLLGDRLDQRKLLAVMHVLAAIPPLLLAWCVMQGLLSYSLLIVTALMGGVFAALSQPARDALLNRVAGEAVQTAVTTVMALQMVMQMVGFALASLGDSWGAAPLLVLQGCIMLSGLLAVALMRVPSTAGNSDTTAQQYETMKKSAGAEILEGLRLVFSSSQIRPAVLLTFAIGVFFAGAFMVLLPLMIREYYGGSAQHIAIGFGLNMAGTVITAATIIIRGGIHRAGRALVLGLLIAAAILVLLYWQWSLFWFYSIIFLWGLGGGVTMAMSRSIVQEAAPQSHRARVMSVYSLGLMGGMPIGSLLIGTAVSWFGPANTVLVCVAGMVISVTIVALRSEVWHLTLNHGANASADTVNGAA